MAVPDFSSQPPALGQTVTQLAVPGLGGLPLQNSERVKSFQPRKGRRSGPNDSPALRYYSLSRSLSAAHPAFSCAPAGASPSLPLHPWFRLTAPPWATILRPSGAARRQRESGSGSGVAPPGFPAAGEKAGRQPAAPPATRAHVRQFSLISRTNSPNKYRESCGPGAASGWYCTQNSGSRRLRNPSRV